MALTLNLGYALLAFGGVLSVSSLSFVTHLPAVAMVVATIGVGAAIGGLVNVIIGAAREY